MVVPVSSPDERTSSSMSRTMPSKSAVASGWKTIAALPVPLSPSSISSLICAVVIANTRSVATGFLSWRLPRRTSRNPIPGRLGGALELRLEALQGGDALFHRRMRGEEVAERLAGAGGEDEERLELARRAEVALRDSLHAAGDLHERRSERARAAGDDRRAAVRRELAVARERLHEEERDHVDDHRDEEQHEEARIVVVVAVARAAAEEEAELDDVGGERGEEARQRHHQHIAVLDVGELVRHHALELGGGEQLHDAGGRAHGRRLGRAAEREGVRHPRLGD